MEISLVKRKAFLHEDDRIRDLKARLTHRDDYATTISELPDHILHQILSNLETIEVVRTSVLSKRWRYLWTSIPYLDFSFPSFYKDMVAKKYPNHSYFRGRLKVFVHLSCQKAFTNFVRRALDSRKGLWSILKFRLFFGETICHGDTDQWIYEAINGNVQELDLTFSPGTREYQLPACLVTCKSLSVLRLGLYFCKLLLPRLTDLTFPGLKSLHISFARLQDEDLFGSYISNCPLLEDLILVECLLPDPKPLEISSNSLKNLTIQDMRRRFAGLWLSKLTVSCPKLVSFNYKGPMAEDYNLQNLSSLDTVEVDLIPGSAERSEEEVGNIIRKMLHGFRSARVLKLSEIQVCNFSPSNFHDINCIY
ncbi:hypothetical protein NMG60_11023164 [Bertholletia excelsa]